VRDDATAAGLAAVLVEVVDGSGIVVARGTSGPGGAFRIGGIPAGTYTIRFTSPGWNTATLAGQTVTAGQLTSASATMTEGSYSLNPITVTTSKTEEKVLDAPAAVEVVSSLDIQERPSTTTIDHVKNKAGVDVIQTGVQSSYVVVRGFNNIFSGASLTMTDNRISRVPSLRANISHLTPTTNMDLDKVEVVLGPGSALYGPNAANGVIHMLTRSPIDYPGVSFSIAGGLRQQSSESDATKISGGLPFTGSDEGLFHGEGRIAIAPSDRFGVKVSGQYFKGTEYAFIDTEEAAEREDALSCIQSSFNLTNPDCLAFSEGLNLTDPEDQALLQTSVNNVCRPNSAGTECLGRDDNLERWTLDGRIDWRPTPETNVILSGGRTQAISSVDLTGLGAAQVVDWAYNYLQARLNHRDLFAQFFWNKSSNDETYLLRSGRPLIDRSEIFVGQLQHAARLGETHRFIYGADLLRTLPDTDGTINGKNDPDDDLTEIGGYLQWEWAIDPKLDFVAAARLDDHSRLEDRVFSPRAALVYKPDPGSSFRATFNRAFSTPTTLNLFLDISAERIPLGGPFRYDIRATGSTEEGHMFMRDANGVPMHMSPFNPIVCPPGTAAVWLTTGVSPHDGGPAVAGGRGDHDGGQPAGGGSVGADRSARRGGCRYRGADPGPEPPARRTRERGLSGTAVLPHTGRVGRHPGLRAAQADDHKHVRGRVQGTPGRPCPAGSQRLVEPRHGLHLRAAGRLPERVLERPAARRVSDRAIPPAGRRRVPRRGDGAGDRAPDSSGYARGPRDRAHPSGRRDPTECRWNRCHARVRVREPGQPGCLRCRGRGEFLAQRRVGANHHGLGGRQG
jgi:hypothetical protein